MTSRPDRTILLAFAAFVAIAGANAVAVKLAIAELPPFLAAAARFGLAGLILAAFAVATRRPLPRGSRLVGTVLFGVFGFALAYFFLYWGLQDAPAGTTMLMLAIVPLLTLLLAIAQGVERLRPLGLLGALIALVGIVIVSADQASLAVPIPALLALVAGAACIAESSVAVKRFPPGDPVPANALGMLLGGALLGGASLWAGEPAIVPARAETWLAMAYLIVPGSIVLFILALYILARWTASATSYGFLLFPLVAVALGAALLEEPIQPTFLLGGAIVLAGVYVGAVYRREPTEATTEPVGEAADIAS